MSESIPIIPPNINNSNDNNNDLSIYQNIPPPLYCNICKILFYFAVDVKHENLVQNFTNNIDKGKNN